MPDARAPAQLTRRHALLGLLLPAAPALLGLSGRAAAAIVPERGLLLHHQHTGEWLRTVYFADGLYLEDSLRDINRLLRDWRTDQMVAIDPRLLDILHLVQRRLAATGPIEVVCGYRSPRTNALLRRRSRGVARNSLHMHGMAVDLCLPGRDLASVHRAALALQAGGVGYYPDAGFVHLDSGPARHWLQRGRVAAGRDGGGPGGSRRTAARRARLASLKRKRRAG